MCGIFGFTTANNKNERDRIRKALNDLARRGPDDASVQKITTEDHGKSVVLGHTRLSIIDLSPAGRQPMVNSSGRYTIIFNGEIYNYIELGEHLKRHHRITFKTNTDTEVLIELWSVYKEKGLSKIRGMFAFAIYDAFEKKITLCRDNFGIKPLYYSCSDNEFVFSSESTTVKNLLEKDPGINIQKSYEYLIWSGYDDSEQTFFKNVMQLEPGHIMQVDPIKNKIISKRRWWNPSIELDASYTFEEAKERLSELFTDSMKIHMRSDVEICAALSGGVDSSAIVCMMKKINPKLKIDTFSYISSDPRLSERKWIDLVNNSVGAKSHHIYVDSSNLGEDIDDLIVTQGEPFVSTSLYAQYRVFKAVKEAGFKVTLDGQGADEIAAGYHGYPGAILHSHYDNNDYAKMLKFLWHWKKLPSRSIKNAMKSFGAQLVDVNHFDFIYGTVNNKPEWLNFKNLKDVDYTSRPYRPRLSKANKSRRLAEKLRNSLYGFGMNSLLRHADRNSMRWSIESRVPFLNSDIAEFMLRLPENYLVSSTGNSKHLLKTSLFGVIPNQILERKDKIGFETPELTWLLHNKNFIDSILDNIKQTPLLNSKQVISYFENCLNGRNTFNRQAWRIVNYSRWAQINNYNN